MTRNILIVKTSSLGDVIHNMPAVSDIARHWPNARIAWLVEESYAPLVALHRAVDQVIPVALRRWRRQLSRVGSWRELAQLRAVLKELRFDVIIDTQGLVKSAVLTRMAAGERVGFDRASAREPLAARAYDRVVAVDRALHATERCRRLCAAALGYSLGASGPLDYGLKTVPNLEVNLGSSRQSRRALLLHGTARAEKLWPEEHWHSLARSLAAQGWQIEFVRGSEAEAARSERLAAALPNARVHPPLAIDQLTHTMQGLGLVIGVDTGLLHLAAALEVPLVGIFGATSAALTGPLGRAPIEVCGSTGSFPTFTDVLNAVSRLLPSSELNVIN